MIFVCFIMICIEFACTLMLFIM